MKQEQQNQVEQFLLDCVSDGVFPGANAAIVHHGEVTYFSVGKRALLPTEEDNDLSTLYDLASLSKVVVTTPLILQLIEQKQLSFETKVSTILPEFPFSDITIFHLLTHTSGLAADLCFDGCLNGDMIWQRICHSKRAEVAGKVVLYSDLGYITLGKILQAITNKRIDELAQERLFVPLQMKQTMYCPSPNQTSQCAPTEISLYKHVLLRGEVHDRKANVMDGIAGHAGVFATIEDLSHVAKMHLQQGSYEGKQILKQESVELFHQVLTPEGEIKRGIGFLVRDERSPFATKSSEQAYMHTGFTGTSILIDPTYDLAIILLSNRVHPTRENQKIYEMRSAFHTMVYQTLEI